MSTDFDPAGDDRPTWLGAFPNAGPVRVPPPGSTGAPGADDDGPPPGPEGGAGGRGRGRGAKRDAVEGLVRRGAGAGASFLRTVPEVGSAVYDRVGSRAITGPLAGAGVLLAGPGVYHAVQSMALTPAHTEIALGGLAGIVVSGAIRSGYAEGRRDGLIGLGTSIAGVTGMLDVGFRLMGADGIATKAGEGAALLGGALIFAGAASWKAETSGQTDPERIRALRRFGGPMFIAGTAGAIAMGAVAAGFNAHDAALMEGVAAVCLSASAVPLASAGIMSLAARRAEGRGLS